MRETKIKSLIPVALVFLMLVLGCGQMKNITERNFSDFNPYKGSVSDLLKPELSGSLVTFKFIGSRDITADYKGAVEAKGFTYMQESGGIGAQVEGALVNFSSVADAEAYLAEISAENKGTLSKKGQGKRFTAKEGSIVGWTNGSILCVVTSSFAKPAGNFENAAPF